MCHAPAVSTTIDVPNRPTPTTMHKPDQPSAATNPTSTDDAGGMHKGLTSYGDKGFSLFLRKAFIKGAGYTDGALTRPVIGIASTGSAYNPCHGNAPQLLEAVKRGIKIGRAHV